MKKIFVLAITALLVFASCSSSSKVTRVDAGTRTDLSGRWNDTDVKIVCETLIADALASPRIDSFIKAYSAQNNGNLPAVIVGRFKNTSSEHIDTSIISGIMRTAIINSGKLDFVEGGDTRDELRAERQDQQANASEETASALANETGAKLMLTGEVNCMVDQTDTTMARSYFVKANMTDIESNRILWQGENNSIKKVITRSKTKF
jgi:PBP1b-binding outer membrane lipoprotein LpoB